MERPVPWKLAVWALRIRRRATATSSGGTGRLTRRAGLGKRRSREICVRREIICVQGEIICVQGEMICVQKAICVSPQGDPRLPKDSAVPHGQARTPGMSQSQRHRMGCWLGKCNYVETDWTVTNTFYQKLFVPSFCRLLSGSSDSFPHRQLQTPPTPSLLSA